MSELRLNPLTNDWVILASRRSERPRSTTPRPPREPLPAFSPSCPFCPGNETETALECERDTAGDGWRTRTVLNRYPALSLLDEVPAVQQEGIRISVTGHGNHEVIIETPRHDVTLALQPLDQVEAVVRTFRSRYRANAALPGAAHITLYQNHGEAAGSSLVHPHSQLITSPVVPSQVLRRLAAFKEHQSHGVPCAVCAVLEDELREGLRLLHENAHFAAFIPFAALSAYHIWVIPKRHAPAFGDVTDDEIGALASTLRTVLRQLRFALDDPDYNAALRAPPIAEADGHWYLAIVPRLAQAAGFEMGSGMYINPVYPEVAAATLRNAPVSPAG